MTFTPLGDDSYSMFATCWRWWRCSVLVSQYSGQLTSHCLKISASWTQPGAEAKENSSCHNPLKRCRQLTPSRDDLPLGKKSRSFTTHQHFLCIFFGTQGGLTSVAGGKNEKVMLEMGLFINHLGRNSAVLKAGMAVLWRYLVREEPGTEWA